MVSRSNIWRSIEDFYIQSCSTLLEHSPWHLRNLTIMQTYSHFIRNPCRVISVFWQSSWFYSCQSHEIFPGSSGNCNRIQGQCPRSRPNHGGLEHSITWIFISLSKTSIAKTMSTATQSDGQRAFTKPYEGPNINKPHTLLSQLSVLGFPKCFLTSTIPLSIYHRTTVVFEDGRTCCTPYEHNTCSSWPERSCETR